MLANQSHEARPYSVLSLEMTFRVTAITVATRDSGGERVCAQSDTRSSSDTPSLGHVVCGDSVEVNGIRAPNGEHETKKDCERMGGRKHV